MMSKGDDFEPSDLPARLREAYRYWQRIGGQNLIPARRDFDPIDIPRLLPHVILVEVLRDQADGAFLDFRFRLIGTYVDERMSERYVGRRLSEIDGKGPGSEIWAAYHEVRDSKKPKIISLNYVGPHENIKRSREIFLPLSNGGEEVAYICAFIVFE